MKNLIVLLLLLGAVALDFVHVGGWLIGEEIVAFEPAVLASLGAIGLWLIICLKPAEWD